MNIYHKSVLLHEAIDYLEIQSGKRYIDATLGGGGHTFGILEAGGIVLGVDVDQDALNFVEDKLKIKNEKLKIHKEELTLVRGNFRDIDQIAKENGFDKVAGILLDLGVSSHQFDSADRGFSFSKNAFLDMRMDKTLGVTAKDLLQVLPKAELIKLLVEYGEERFAGRIAEAIVRERERKQIETTQQLEELIKKVVPNKKDSLHPATRTFQALRIAVNSELESLQEVLPKARELLEEKGRIVVISFHSLEDRIVKRTFSEWEAEKYGTMITQKPIEPTEAEVTENVRSRSAKMRVFEKI